MDTGPDDPPHGGGHREPPHRHPGPLHRAHLVGTGPARSPRFDADAVFAACARTGTAVEINSRPERRDPPEAAAARPPPMPGALVSIDTDAHAPGQLEWLANGCEQAVEADIDTDRIVNSWPMDSLLEWTSAN